jgi:hypothetical protein
MGSWLQQAIANHAFGTIKNKIVPICSQGEMKMQLNRAIIEAAIVGFERQKQSIDETIAELRAQLGGTSSGPGPRVKVADAAPVKTKRTMSAKGKAAIRAAMKKRWAAYHAKESEPVKKTVAKTTAKKTAPAKKSAPKRKLSAAAKAKLVANLAKARAAKKAKATSGGTVPF